MIFCGYAWEVKLNLGWEFYTLEPVRDVRLLWVLARTELGSIFVSSLSTFHHYFNSL